MTEERPRVTPGRVAGLYAAGAVGLTLLDALHTHTDTIRYPAPLLLKAAWWVPLSFGGGLAAGGVAFALGHHALGGRRPPPSWPALAAGLVLFAGLYAATGLLAGPSVATTGLLAAAAAAVFACLDRTLAGAAMALVAVVVGPAIEATYVHLGLFEYTRPDLLGVPLWLPALYACGAPVLGQAARRLLAPPPG